MFIKKSVGNVKGFTLVELLIVVAIIGVLASQGVPAYRRMIQKSRKGEAQNMLAAISAGEAAFFSEYGVYGSHLARMGVQLDGQANPLNFTYVGAVHGICTAQAAIVPAVGVVSALDNTQYQIPVANTEISRIGRTSLNANCLVPAIMAAPFNTYTATASGFVYGGSDAIKNACTGGGAVCDTWRIDQNRNLVNVQDGVL